ncbi:hypothetical protein FQN51_001747 [Onygenales sp. PD_10]|nr:hypothetical protein FQN51_001747 [Onygenales sp. PD_10]
MENPTPDYSLPWTNCDRGIIDNGVATRKCSTDFLSRLYAAYVDCIEKDEVHIDKTEANISYRSIMEEICRLTSYPSLFPSIQASARFHALLSQATTVQIAIAKDKHEKEKSAEFIRRANDIAREEDKMLQILNRPSYKLDLLPWEQFLLKGSPGSGVRLPHTTPNATIQLMPIGGIALHLTWMRNRYLTFVKCRNSVLPQTINPASSSAGAQNHASVCDLPTSKLEYEQKWVTLTPNIYFERYYPMPRDGNVIERLEKFSNVIEALEGEEETDFNGTAAGIYAMDSSIQMAGNEVSAVHRAFNKLFTTLTPDQVQNFHSFLQEATASNPDSMNANIETIPARENEPIGLAKNNLFANMTMTTPMTPPLVSNVVSRAPASRGKRVRENGKLRPLNSFIAFRSYYSTAFPELSQKIKSGVLRLLWNSDPFKAKWAILAKAYSIVRDNHAGQVSLESFLALNGPLIGIVAPSDYLRVMGLQLVVNMDKQYSVIETNHNIGPTQDDLTTNLSVNDIVDHCYQTGYVAGVLPANIIGSQGVGVAMAVSAQPNHTHFAQNHSSQQQRQQQRAASTRKSRPSNTAPPKPVIANQEPAMPTGTRKPENNHVLTPGVGHDSNDLTAVPDNAVAPAPNETLDCESTAIEVPYTVGEFDHQLRSAMNDFPIAPDDNGYFTLFNPELRNPVYIYNPYNIQNDFDPYDIGDYIEM